MKKTSLIVLFMVMVAHGFSQFIPPTPSYPSSVNLFDLFEVSFKIPWTYSNPYDPDTIMIYGVFTGPGNSSDTVHAFYYEDYTFSLHQNGYEVASHNPSNDGWRIRFTPTKTGTWSFKIRGFDASGELTVSYMNVNYTFTCNSVSNGEGFISKANSRFLRRDVVTNGQRKYRSFFPVGPNVAWYDNKGNNPTQPLGIYQYEQFIDSLDGNCNYMRIWLSRYQHLSLYGPEYTQIENGHTKVYFDSTINQKDSAELDHIITYALQHGIVIMPAFLTHESFLEDPMDPSSENKWSNNPYNTILGLISPCAFFTDANAKRITKNLFRYIVSRWGYATNVISWELWNEVEQMFGDCESSDYIDQAVLKWHEEMSKHIRNTDPFKHLVSTSLGNTTSHAYIYANVFNYLDLVQAHNYQNIQNAESRNQLLFRLYKKTGECHNIYPEEPFLMGEFGFAQDQNIPKYSVKDPYGIDLHNSLWASLFNSSIGAASFWWWPYVNSCGLYKRFTPLLNFCHNLPILSESFVPNHTGTVVGRSLLFDNNLETYYMINATEDTIYGWSQDTAFAYQSLRWLTDSAHIVHTVDWGDVQYFKDNAVYDSLGYVYTLSLSKRPQPSYNSNTIEIPITYQNIGIYYTVKWYNSETGTPYNIWAAPACVHINGDGEKVISFDFPSYIRDLQNHTINNTFGDAVFVLTKKNVVD